MTTPNHSDIALLTEHFGYPPVSLLDDIINSINILAERALNSVEQGLLAQPPASLGFKPHAPPTSKSRSRNHNNDHNNNSDAHATSADAPHAQDPEEAARHEIENGTHQLETLLCASIDRNFDKFELYVMRNILCVRPDEHRDWIRLAHYEGLDFSSEAGAPPSQKPSPQDADEDEGTPTVERVRRLHRRLQASQQLNAMLDAEHARNERLLADLRSLVGGGGGADPDSGVVVAKRSGSHDPANGPAVKREERPASTAAVPPRDERAVAGAPLAFLHDRGGLTAVDARSPLTTTTAFALSQLQALRALSTALRKLYPDLQGEGGGGGEGDADDDGAGGEEESSSGGGGGRKSWRRQRLEYVETETKKHLENMRGLELGRDGEVIDGEWQGEGRGRAPGEVEGLEKVVALLGGGPGAAAAPARDAEEMDET